MIVSLNKVEKALNEDGYFCQIEKHEYYDEIDLDTINIRALNRDIIVEVYDLGEEKLEDMKMFKSQKDTIQYLKNIGVLEND